MNSAKDSAMNESAQEPKECRNKFTITATALAEIERSIGSRRSEEGGALGGSRKDGVARFFHFDCSARTTGATYSPDHESLNRLFARDWNPQGINLLGFVHSHPPGCRGPSSGDLAYARRILDAIPELERLFLPIVQSVPDSGRFSVYPYAVVRDGKDVRVEELELCILDETFKRVTGAYDLERLRRSRVVYIGVGGAAGFIEDMARTGVGEHILIDPDLIEETNLATQQCYRKDIGRPKVQCLAERVRDINPAAVVIPIQTKIEDLSDSDFARLITNGPDGSGSIRQLICGLTDHFEAQSRVNRLALQFGIPSLCAQVYWEGRGAEITFTYPGVTPACHRCMLSNRYKAYAEYGFQNDVTSDGSPIFSTTRLNALKGFIAMALLHHGSAHPRWGDLLERISPRTLLQIRMDPDFSSTLKLKVFDRVLRGADRKRIMFDDVVWLPQKPEAPKDGDGGCPDCGGNGDLRSTVGRFPDTRNS